MKRNEFLKSIIGLPFLVSAIGEGKGNVIPSYARNQTIIVTPNSRLDGDTIDWEYCDVQFKGFSDFKYIIKDKNGVEIYSLDRSLIAEDGFRRTIINRSKELKIANTTIVTPDKGVLRYSRAISSGLSLLQV